MDVFQNWLNQLAQELKLNEILALDEKNRCFLMFDDSMLVEIEYKAEDFDEALKYNMSMIVSAPKHPKREKFMDAILIENDFNKVLEILRERWLVRAFKKAKQKILK